MPAMTISQKDRLRNILRFHVNEREAFNIHAEAAAFVNSVPPAEGLIPRFWRHVTMADRIETEAQARYPDCLDFKKAFYFYGVVIWRAKN